MTDGCFWKDNRSKQTPTIKSLNTGDLEIVSAKEWPQENKDGL